MTDSSQTFLICCKIDGVISNLCKFLMLPITLLPFVLESVLEFVLLHVQLSYSNSFNSDLRTNLLVFHSKHSSYSKVFLSVMNDLDKF